jgi:hypothetical protein
MPSRKRPSAKEKSQPKGIKGKKRKSTDRCSTSPSPKPKRIKPIAKSRQAAVMTEEEDAASASYGAASDVVTEEPIELSSEGETENESSETELGKYKLIWSVVLNN